MIAHKNRFFKFVWSYVTHLIVRFLEPEKMECSKCGGCPSVVVLDGTAIGLKKENLPRGNSEYFNTAGGQLVFPEVRFASIIVKRWILVRNTLEGGKPVLARG